MSKDLQHFNNFVIFKTKTGKVNIDVFFKDENLWLTQKKISELFEVERSVITKHLSNIFKEGELEEKSNVQFLHTPNSDKPVKFYPLKAILSVGYRVNSQRAIEFRSWASDVLKEYIIKGFAMDDERLKQIQHFGIDYFEEQLERIAEIRTSERRLYQKITDIYSLSADYDKNSPTTKEFYATVQNKLHYAITGKTAAEIIYTEADAKKPDMGLKTWKNTPDGKILKSDTVIAKNYLNEEHIKNLNRIVGTYLDLAENNAKKKIVINMKNWIDFLDKFIKLLDYPILLDRGKVLMLEAKIKAETEFEQFRIEQDKNFESDFDKFIEGSKKKLKDN